MRSHRGHLASVPHTGIRRALSVFRGYRRASEDDDEVFVCSPRPKVTMADKDVTCDAVDVKICADALCFLFNRALYLCTVSTNADASPTDGFRVP